jgi:polyphosphate kinase
MPERPRLEPDAHPGHRRVDRPGDPDVDLSDPSLYLNREISWLKFNARVLDQARDEEHPVLERVKFLAIAAANLDEFYMVRVATLQRHQRAGLDRHSPDGLDLDQQIRLVRQASEAMMHEIGRLWSDQLRPLLATHGLQFLEPADYTPEIREYLDDHFNVVVCPVLTPLAFDPGHPFPYISNRSKNVAVVVAHRGETRFARVKVPNKIRRFIEIPARLTGGATAFAYLEDVVMGNLQELFPGVHIVSAHLFRIIRDSDVRVRADETDDLLVTVDRELRRVRRRPLALLEIEQATPERVVGILTENFQTARDVIVRSRHRLGFADWMRIARLHRAPLKDRPLRQRVCWQGSTPDEVFDRVKYEDVLIHQPFDGFGTFEHFLRSAVLDPKVIAIKMTLYRVGSRPPIVDLLLEAADRGKQVAVLVELKARFEERQNIEWATRLEEAGVHVVYGMMDLKTHCKLCLIVRKGSGSGRDAIERYAHLGTGNYNPATAAVYTDLGLLTSDPRIVADLSELFNVLTGYSNQVSYREIAVAPARLRRRLQQLLRRETEHAEAGRPAGIIIKVNSLTDPAMIRELYRASRAGVSIDLIVRGMCVLRPGMPGISDTIRVRSIVGRFLEHSRIFAFENGGAREIYLSSADLMERNLDRRVEVMWPIHDPSLANYIRDTVLDAYLRDNRRALLLRANGDYEAPPRGGHEPSIEAQLSLMEALPPSASGSDGSLSPRAAGTRDCADDWRVTGLNDDSDA